MVRATIIRGGKWKDNLYTDDRVYGDFQSFKDAIKWIGEESQEFRGGWEVVEITIKEKTCGTD